MVAQALEEKRSEADILRECCNDSLRAALSEIQGADLTQILGQVNHSVEQRFSQKMKDQAVEGSLINHPIDYKTVRNKYTEGANSIEKNLPCPDVVDLEALPAYQWKT